MAITFPRSFPHHQFSAVDFEPMAGISTNKLNGGGVQVREFARPRWIGTFATRELLPLNDSHRKIIQLWRAWWATLKGGLNTFYAYDATQPWPINHKAGAGLGAWGGTGGVSAISDVNTLSVDSVPSALTLEPGDYVGLVQGGNYALHRVAEAAAASGSSIALTVYPDINLLLFDSGATVNFYKPVVVMVPIQESFSAPQGTTPGVVQFQAMQKVV